MLIAQSSSSGSALSGLLLPLLLLVAFYLLLIRPQRARARQTAEVRRNLVAGTRVLTTSGMHAVVAEVGGDDTVLLEIAPGVVVRFASQAVLRVVEPAAGEGAGADAAPEEPA